MSKWSNSCTPSSVTAWNVTPVAVDDTTLKQRELLGQQIVSVDLSVEGLAELVVALARRAQHVAARLGDLERVAAQPRIVGHVHVRLLARPSGLPPDETPDRLAEEQLGRRGGGVDAHTQAGDVDAFGDHPHRHEPRAVAVRELGDLPRRLRVVADHDVGRSSRTGCGAAGRSPWACSWSIAITSPPASRCS